MASNNQYYDQSGADTNPFAKLLAPRYVSQRVGLPLDEIKASGDAMQTRWDTGNDLNMTMEDILKNAVLNASPNDKEYVNRMMQEFNTGKDAFGGRKDYHNFLSEIKRNALDIKSAVAPIAENSAMRAKQLEEAGKYMSILALRDILYCIHPEIFYFRHHIPHTLF